MFIWLKCPIMNDEHASNTWNNLCLHNIMDYTTQKMVWLWELGTFVYKFIEFCVSPVVGNIIEVVVEVSQVSVLFLLQQHSWRLTRVFIYRVSARANIHRMLNKCRQARKVIYPGWGSNQRSPACKSGVLPLELPGRKVLL